MLLLLFEIGAGRYAMKTSGIVEVIPRVRVRKIPAAPEYIDGIMNYHGTPVVVVDLCVLKGSGRCRARLSTRIILVRYLCENGKEILLGLLAERVTETIRAADGNVRAGGVLIGVVPGPGGGKEDDAMIQWFDIHRALPERILREVIEE